VGSIFKRVAYLSLPILLVLGLPPLVTVAIGLMSPLAVWQLWRVGRGDATNPARWNHLAFFSVGLLIGTAIVETITFGLLAGT
jgi:1,4-dihydroxy-2-naphthoate polyprenyltransferase